MPAYSNKPSSSSLGKILVIALFLLGMAGVIAGMFWYLAQKDSANVTPTLAKEGKLPAQMGPGWSEMDNPAQDGWETEVISNATDKILKKLGTFLAQPKGIDEKNLEPLLTQQFSCDLLLPQPLETTFKDHVFLIERARIDNNAPSKAAGSFNGAKGLAEALQQLTQSIRDAEDIHTKFKLFRIIPQSKDTYTTVQYVAFSGRLPTGMIEQNATWEMQWRLDDKLSATQDPHPRLESIKVTNFELVHSNQPKPLFSDCTESVMGKNDCYRKQFLQGMNTWYERIQYRQYYYLLSHPGLAVADVNGDGLEDLFVCQDEGLPSRLLLQQPDGSVKDASEEWGVNWLHSSRGVLLVDLDNDGKPDLVVALANHVLFAKNMGNRFEIKLILPTGGDTMSLSAADYNHSGKLSVYACVYFSKDVPKNSRGELISGNAIANDGQGGGANSLFRNDIQGDVWKFTDVTKETGLDVNNNRYSFASSWEDYDNDGWLDLYIANDYGVNQLFRNVGGKFVEVAKSVGAEDGAFSMSASWADYNQDGWMDLYVGNMFSGAGNRITFQDKFLHDTPDRKLKYQRFARGNTLLKNVGGKFTDVSEESGTNMGRWAWSSVFADVNNDGLPDLLVANGYITTDDASDL
jgi:hypothetical protein